MLAERGPRREGIVVAPQHRAVRPGDGDVEVAEQHMTELDVRQGEIAPGQEPTPRELRLGDVEELVQR